MASKASKFDLLLPRLCRDGAGIVFAAGNYCRVSGSIEKPLQAMRLQGGSIGVHASDATRDYASTLCNLPLQSATKANEARVYGADNGKRGKQAEHAADAVTCKFCLARLIASGIITADAVAARSDVSAESRAYAIEYGRVSASDALQAMADRAKAAADALAKGTAKAAREKAKAEKGTAAAKASTACRGC